MLCSGMHTIQDGHSYLLKQAHFHVWICYLNGNPFKVTFTVTLNKVTVKVKVCFPIYYLSVILEMSFCVYV